MNMHNKYTVLSITSRTRVTGVKMEVFHNGFTTKKWLYLEDKFGHQYVLCVYAYRYWESLERGTQFAVLLSFGHLDITKVFPPIFSVLLLPLELFLHLDAKKCLQSNGISSMLVKHHDFVFKYSLVKGDKIFLIMLVAKRYFCKLKWVLQRHYVSKMSADVSLLKSLTFIKGRLHTT